MKGMAKVKKEKLSVFRAGTKDGPSFSSKYDYSMQGENGVHESGWLDQQPHRVWLATEPRLYYPLNQRENLEKESSVHLWKADIWPSNSDELKVENHSVFDGICAAKAKSTEQVKKELDWKEIKLEKCDGGMSLMDFSTLAACHWYWHPSGRKDRCQEEGDCSSIKLPKLRSGPHRDIRVKIAALVTSKKWISVLEEIKMESSLPKSSQRVEKNGESSPDEDGNEERIYDLEESIFDLKAYFNFKDDELRESGTKVTEEHSPGKKLSKKCFFGE
ncbi:hypothetical protein AWC38_SpisGene18073 [Stylophora pistillata]|uniref:Uncharacterized protein n=1 Tax=Stylophora pistillata TaxID=50429 RepID=A0A2B4RLB2_STYPI|nr:hypothetical protein AWC38_SpisGene18073 [Stylophora pistillata]